MILLFCKYRYLNEDFEEDEVLVIKALVGSAVILLEDASNKRDVAKG